MAFPKILSDSRLADAAPVASTTAAGFNVLNLTDFRPYTFWQPTAMPATVTVDCGSARAADYCALYGHNLFTKGVTLEVRGSTDNFGASNVLVATRTPTSDDPFQVIFGSASFRYWRLTFTGGTPPSVAIALIGAAFVMPQRLEGGFDPIGRMVDGQANQNENGLPLGRVINFEEWTQTLTFRLVTWTFIRSTWLPLWRSQLRSSPFIFCWESDLFLDELRLVASDGEFTAAHAPGSLADLTFAVRGVVS